MNEILAKRLTFLSRVTIMLFALSLFSLIHKLDSFDLEKDIKAFDIIARVEAQTNIPDALESGEFYDKTLEYVGQTDSALVAQHTTVREQVTQILLDYKISQDEIAVVKGRSDGSTNQFSLIEIPMEGPLDNSGMTSRISLTVDDSLSRFQALTESRGMRVATGLEAASLPNYEASLDQAQNDPMPCRPQLSKVILNKSVLQFKFEDPLDYIGQQSCALTDAIPVTTVEIPGPSLYALLGGDDALVNALRADHDQLNRIHQLYGRMQFGSAQSVAVQDFTQSYKSITILGFTFSTRRYPEAILLFTFLAVAGILLTVGTARRASQSIISQVTESDLVDSLLDSPQMRFIVWVVLPLLTILASLPMYPLGSTETVLFYVGAALTAVMGLVAIVYARGL